jgi:hypothetical protein
MSMRRALALDRAIMRPLGQDITAAAAGTDWTERWR